MSHLTLVSTTYTDPIIENAQFQQIVEDQEPDIACECRWHDETPGDAPAEWIVFYERICCDAGIVIRTWCDPCLQAVLASTKPNMRCAYCNKPHPGSAKSHIKYIEPITRPAA